MTHKRDEFIGGIKFTRRGWPTALPELEASDMVVHALTGPNGTHCLLGWARALTTGYQVRFKIEEAIQKVIQARGFAGCIADFNDQRGPFEAASVWNEAITNLGYVEDTVIRPCP